MFIEYRRYPDLILLIDSDFEKSFIGEMYGIKNFESVLDLIIKYYYQIDYDNLYKNLALLAIFTARKFSSSITKTSIKAEFLLQDIRLIKICDNDVELNSIKIKRQEYIDKLFLLE